MLEHRPPEQVFLPLKSYAGRLVTSSNLFGCSPAMEPEALPARIASRIADLIDAGDLPLESHLSTQRLAEQFSVSRTPVREALDLLAKKGVVEQRANRGYFVKAKGRKPDRRGKDKREVVEHKDAPAAYYKLAEDWVRDRIPAEVGELELRDRYGLTKSQLTAVLNRASAEGWIERKAGYGWRLLPVAKTPEALEQIYRFRLIVEPAGLLEPTFKLERSFVERFSGTFRLMLDGAIETWSPERLYRIGVEFHEELLRMSGNSILHQALRRANSLRRLIEYRVMIDRKRVYDETREHLKLLGILDKGDIVEASFFLRQHLSGALRRKRGGSALDN